jgi:hypothetical protein
VPKRDGFWFSEIVRSVNQLKSAEMLTGLLHPVASQPADSDYTAPYTALEGQTEAQRRTMLAVFEALRDMDRSRGRIFVFVHLPVERDCFGVEKPEVWRRWITGEISALGIPVIDLTPEFLKLPAAELLRMYIQNDIKNYVGARGHYSVQGNEYVARLVYEGLKSVPEIGQRLLTETEKR